MTKNTCPICGSKNIKRSEEDSFDKLTLGTRFKFKEISFKCTSCKEEFDLGETDKNYLKAQKQAQAELVKNIIDDLNKKGITMSFFERVFELPIRTLTRWKTGDFSAASLALLRIVKTYPWITKAAEYRFGKTFSNKVLIEAANNRRIGTINPSPSVMAFLNKNASFLING
jgi:predicted RNA-binding Zn-ribbon protein involved in translation (DUF1610 family)